MTDPRPQTRRRLEPDQLTALWYLCCSDNTTPLERVIEILDPPARDLIPGLSYAIERKRLNMIHYLLEYGVPVNGHRVLDAIRERSIPILEMLREYGWDDVNSMVYDREAVTALTFATDDPKIVSYLLSLGANPNLGPAIGPIGAWGRFYFIPNSGVILQSAAHVGNVESLNLLIEHGAVLSNAAAMHSAVDGGSVDMIARLFELGADVEERDNMMTMGRDCYGTPLLRAVAKSKVGAVRFLLEKGASVTKKSQLKELGTALPGEGETALELVKKDWVDDEIRKLVEEVGEREGVGAQKELDVREQGEIGEMEGGEKEWEVIEKTHIEEYV